MSHNFFYNKKYFQSCFLLQYSNSEKNILCRQTIKQLLTNNLELYKIASNWLGVDLTLVSTRISLLNVLYLQNPLVTSHVVDGSEAHVCRVGITANCQDVQVVMPNPGHLQRKAYENKTNLRFYYSQ